MYTKSFCLQLQLYLIWIFSIYVHARSIKYSLSFVRNDRENNYYETKSLNFAQKSTDIILFSLFCYYRITTLLVLFYYNLNAGDKKKQSKQLFSAEGTPPTKEKMVKSCGKVTITVLLKITASTI